jgi:hypothetical protein
MVQQMEKMTAEIESCQTKVKELEGQTDDNLIKQIEQMNGENVKLKVK